MMVWSNTKAEYYAIATTTQEIEAVRSLLIELGIQVLASMKIMTNNLGATLAKNPIGYIKLKHVAEIPILHVNRLKVV